ncbi:hypothetical protein Tco_1393115 [Tanacetum coccineum]
MSRNSAWFKEKVMLAEALESGVALDEEQMTFLADNRDTVTTCQAYQELCNEVDKMNKTVNESLTAELERYKEQIKLFEERQKCDLNDREKYIDNQLREVLVDRNAKVFDFQNQIHSLKLQLSAIVESHKTLSTTVDVLKKESKAKEDKYLKEIIDLEKKESFRQCELGYQNHLYLTQAQRKVPSLYCGNIIVKQHAALSVIDTEKTLELAEESRSSQRNYRHERLFTQMETEVAKISIERKTFEIKEKELLLENDRLLELIISQDLLHTVVNTLTAIADYQNMEKSYLDEYNENLKLQAELSKKNEIVEKDELLVYVSATCPSSSKQSEKLIAVTPINKNKNIRSAEPRTSSSNIQKQVDTCKTKDTNKPLLPSIGVISSTSASESKPLGNTKKNRISRPTSNNKKNNEEDHLRSIKSSLNKKNRVSEHVYNADVKYSVLNANSELIYATCNECMFDAIHDLCVLDYLNDVNVRVKPKFSKIKRKKVWKPTGKIFTHVGYSWKPTGRTFTIDGNMCPLTRITSTTVVLPMKPISTTAVKKIPPISNNSGKLKDMTNIGLSRKSKSVDSKISNNSEPKKNWGSNVSTSPSSSRVHFRSFKSSSGTWTRVDPRK